MNAFLIASLLLDRRPARKQPSRYPSVVDPDPDMQRGNGDRRHAALDRQPGLPRCVRGVRHRRRVDGSDGRDRRCLRLPIGCGCCGSRRTRANRPRSTAVSTKRASTSSLRSSRFVSLSRALKNLVERYLSDPPNTRAVAGTMLVRNSRQNWVTEGAGMGLLPRHRGNQARAIAVSGDAGRAGRVFDLRSRDARGSGRVVRLRRPGHRADMGDAAQAAGASAMPKTHAASPTRPTTLHQFVRQRQRWARGMMEAFRQFPGHPDQPRMSTLFVWWNLLFPWLDLAYTLSLHPRHLLALSASTGSRVP